MSSTVVQHPISQSLWVRITTSELSFAGSKIRILFVSSSVRGLHQELQCSIQASAEASGGGRSQEKWGWRQSTSRRTPARTTSFTPSYHGTHHLLLLATRYGRKKGEIDFCQQRSPELYKTIWTCSSPGCSALLLHPVVWILLGPQPHCDPTGQTTAGKQHHHCGQVLPSRILLLVL